MTKKILIVTPGRLPVPAARGGAVESLVQILMEENETEHYADLHILSISDAKAKEKSKKYQYSTCLFLKMGCLYDMAMKKHLVPYRLLDYFFAKKACAYIKKEKCRYDAIVIQNETVHGSVFMKGLKGKYYFHAHNDLIPSIKKGEQDFLSSCEGILSISEYLSKNLKKDANLKLVTTVYNGIHTELFHKKLYINERNTLRQSYGIKQEDVVVTFSGRMIAQKGVKELLQAFLLLPDELNIKILIIGSTFFGKNQENPYLKELKELCKGRESDMIFTGYIPYEYMPKYYAMADIGCIPSIWNEPFGLTVVEQMAMELPVVVTDAGAIPEIVDSSCGRIVKRDEHLCENLADALKELYMDAELRLQMGKKGRRIVEEKFSTKQYSKAWFGAVCKESKRI